MGDKMPNYTTEDCKKFLIEQYPDTQEKKWKRTKKYKDESGVVCRDFSYGEEYTVTLQETTHGLIEKQNMEYIVENNLPARFDSVSISQMLFGGELSTINPSDSYEKKFLHVLENGIDWQASEGKRSAFDFAKNIDFIKFTKDCDSKGINLANNFLDHVYASIMFIFEMDETYMPHHITTKGFDDSYLDLLEIQRKIENGYNKNQLPIILKRETINGVLSTIEETRSMMDCEGQDEDMDEDTCNKVLNDMAKIFKKHLTKSPKP